MALLNLSPSGPARPPAATDGDAAVKDVTIATFMADVIDASRRQPVIVDFWAPWCGPCKQIGPVLEKLVKGSHGAVRLAKINIDKDPEIAQQMRVQSIPAVFAFYQGQPIDGFMGAQPEPQLKAWVEQLIKMAGGTPSEDAPDSLEGFLKQATAMLANGDAAGAQEIFMAILETEPANGEAYAGALRSLIATGDLKKARAMLDSAAPEMLKHKAVETARTALELAEQAAGASSGMAELEARTANNPNDYPARYDLALALYAKGERERAVDELLTIIKQNRAWNDDAARKQLVKIFEALGFSDPVAVAGRKKLSSILFS